MMPLIMGNQFLFSFFKKFRRRGDEVREAVMQKMVLALIVLVFCSCSFQHPINTKNEEVKRESAFTQMQEVDSTIVPNGREIVVSGLSRLFKTTAE